MLLYLSLLISYFRNRLFGHEWLVGADCVVRWSGDTGNDSFIISFAPEPDIHTRFDDYGWSVDETFMYLPDIRSFLTFIHDCRRMGHQFTNAQLIYAFTAE